MYCSAMDWTTGNNKYMHFINSLLHVRTCIMYNRGKGLAENNQIGWCGQKPIAMAIVMGNGVTRRI